MPAIRILAATVAAAALVFAAQPALAADPAPSAHQVELATRVFAAMHMERTMANVTQAMAPMMTRQFDTMAPQLTPAQRQALGVALNDMMKEMTGKLTAQMIPVYAATFSEKELNDLLAFYSSPTGQAVIDKTPLVMTRLQPAMSEMMPTMMARFRERVCAEVGCPPAAKP
jgi:hypothetical protein